jgi:uncharacterized membrane protein YhhN
VRRVWIVLALAFAIGGGALYLVTGTHLAYYVGSFAVFPLLCVAFSHHAESRAEALNEGETPTPVPPMGGFGAGPSW